MRVTQHAPSSTYPISNTYYIKLNWNKQKIVITIVKASNQHQVEMLEKPQQEYKGSISNRKRKGLQEDDTDFPDNV